MRAHRAQTHTPIVRAARARSFTLIELLLIIGIIGILSALATLRLGNALGNQNVEGAARRIAADFDLARRHAMSVSAAQSVRLKTGSDPSYTLVGLPHPDRSTQTYTVSLARDCFGARLVAYDFGGDSDLTFDMYGVPDSAGELVIDGGARKRRIAVDGTNGHVSVTE